MGKRVVSAASKFGSMIWLIVLAVASLAGCSSDQDAQYQTHFDTAIKKVLGDNSTKVVPVKELTNFGWSEVCVALPYAGARDLPLAEIEKRAPWINYETHWGLLFVNSKREIVAAIKIDRMGIADYVKESTGGCIPNAKAKVEILRDNKVKFNVISG